MLFYRDTKFLWNDGIKYSSLKLIIIVHIEHNEDLHLREVMKAGNEKSDLSTMWQLHPHKWSSLTIFAAKYILNFQRV